MNRLAPLLLLFVPTIASALTSPRHGPYVDAAGGLALWVPPLAAGPGWQVGAGWWWGPYDDDYAIGSFTSLGGSVRQAWLDGELVTVPGIEVRRGWDLLVVKPYVFAAVGPELSASGAGVQATIGGGVKWRFDPTFGAIARVELGGGLSEDPGARAGLVLGFEWSSPHDRRSR